MVLYLLYKAVIYFNIFIVIYVVMISLINVIQMLIAMIFSVMYIKKARFQDIKQYKVSYNMVPISILVPAHNEDKIIIQSIKSLMALEYLTYEIIVVNDGS
ncbi:MAG: glycosyltransferase, partial [Treponema sp.]|nr:glycosyltransferase [Treponema sp.]